MAMKMYFHNLHLWFVGFTKLRSIPYKPGWGPWTFLLPYCTTYLAGTLAGYGVVSLSRVWYDRRFTSRFAATMTRILRTKHGAETGPILWGSVSVRKS